MVICLTLCLLELFVVFFKQLFLCLLRMGTLQEGGGGLPHISNVIFVLCGFNNSDSFGKSVDFCYFGHLTVWFDLKWRTSRGIFYWKLLCNVAAERAYAKTTIQNAIFTKVRICWEIRFSFFNKKAFYFQKSGFLQRSALGTLVNDIGRTVARCRLTRQRGLRLQFFSSTQFLFAFAKMKVLVYARFGVSLCNTWIFDSTVRRESYQNVETRE